MARMRPPGVALSILWLAIAVVFLTWPPFSWLRGGAFVVFLGLGLWGVVAAFRRRRDGRGRDE